MNLEELRKEVRKRLEAKKKEQERLAEPDPPPLYDEVFWKGLQEIDDDFADIEWSDIVVKIPPKRRYVVKIRKDKTMKLFLRRLIRRLRFAFRFREMWKWKFESCQRCGACLHVVYKIPDEQWKVIMGHSGGILCLNCLFELASAVRIDMHFEFITTLL